MKLLEVERREWVWKAYRDGNEVVSGGITECWPGRGYAWFHDKGMSKRDWVQATKQARECLKEAMSHFNRIEIAVYENHPAGHRWAEKLGFNLEATLPRYMPDGSKGCLYAMISGD